MTNIKVNFEFLSPWHMGSGFGAGAYLDALVVRSGNGLPYIPGRSVKGLFREAVQLAEDFDQVPTMTTVTLFGSRDPQISRYDSVPGVLCFTSANLGEAMETWAEKQPERPDQLFTVLASTRIDEKGLAQDQHLRRFEAAWPLTLTAEVKNVDECPGWRDILHLAAPLIRQAGSHRHRGLGRVKVTIDGEVRS